MSKSSAGFPPQTTPSHFEKRLRALSKDRRSGSGTLARDALREAERFLENSTEANIRPRIEQMVEGIERLAHEQRAMGLLQGVAEGVKRELAGRGRTLADEGRALVAIRSLRAVLEQGVGSMSARAVPLFPATAVALTMSDSSEVLAVLQEAGRRRRLARVIVLESLPGGEGRTLVRRLRTGGISATCMPDALASAAVGQADLALVGADTIWSDGTVLTKVGAHPLALLCAYRKVPFYVTGLSLKVRPHPLSREPRARRKALDGVLADGRGTGSDGKLFEFLEPDLMTGFLSERGFSKKPLLA